MKILKIYELLFAIKKNPPNWRVQIQKILFYDVFSDPVTGEKLERPESQNDRNTGMTIKQERLASWNDRKNRV